MQCDMETFSTFAERLGLTFEVAPASHNPHMTDDEWSKEASHWAVTIGGGSRSTTSLFFSQGSGHRQFNKKVYRSRVRDWFNPGVAKAGERVPHQRRPARADDVAEWERVTDPIPPTLAEVLECLQSDMQSMEGSLGFEDWAADLGIDPDSRKGLQSYLATQEQVVKLRLTLGVACEDFLDIEP